ncbi:MAG: pyruvate:ferredoxin (flavodoxin) oxidoreductase, partial [Candidatus Muiribacteriota bacterium]
MTQRKKVTIDGNSAAAYVAHATNEVIAIYPITPSSGMGEISDEKSAAGEKNIWGTIPKVSELQSEGGASGAVHGALSAGALTTTFTASQGLLLMIPNMYKIAGELTPSVFHVSARAVATHALSIFGDHSDVMTCRGTGWGMLTSANPQEVMDFALISQAASLESRIPFVHFFDGFRTSHEIQKVDQLSFDDMKALINDDYVIAHRNRALNPERPSIKGTSQNPDVFFQHREAVNGFYDECPSIVKNVMDRFAKITGRNYDLVEYVGAQDAERVIVVMASGADVVHETVEDLVKNNEKVGVLKIRLYRPFPTESFLNYLPKTAKKIAVLDRTKEPGATGEPLYTDIVAAVGEGFRDGKITGNYPLVIGGRYGLGSKDFTPAMVKGVFDNLNASTPMKNFTVGINDDVTHRSLKYDTHYKTDRTGVVSAMFYGLGSDGTVGANKNSAKIIGEQTDKFINAYFVYDSKKAGSMTVSHLRFSDKPLRSSYLIQENEADLVACHNFSFLEKYEMTKYLKKNGVFLINTPVSKDEVWDRIPYEVQKELIEKQAKVYVLNAIEIADNIGLGGRINTIMQTAFFKIANVIPFEDAVNHIKKAIRKSYSKAGEKVVKMNEAAVDEAVAHLYEITVPAEVTGQIHREGCRIPSNIPEFWKNTTCELIAQKGEELPVSAFPVDGTYPLGTTKLEKRNIALNIPVWDKDVCIQCGICSFVCPHASIRMKVYDGSNLDNAPETFKSTDSKIAGYKDMKFSIQVAPEDCTGCGACVYNCPAKDKNNPGRKAINMETQLPLREQEAANFEFFLNIPELPFDGLDKSNLRNIQLAPHMFEFSGACAGCGETPYLKLLSQLFGDRALIANATGCSSIYGGNLPTTPYTTRPDGRGPAWSNSLFEDNAEFGFGMRLTTSKFNQMALELLSKLEKEIGSDLVNEIKNAAQTTQPEIEKQRARIEKLKNKLQSINTPEAKNLHSLADYLIKKSVWIVGGDGWAYDIGYGGLDHVLANDENINVLVMDTEVYSNTGGQSSKATPIGASAKFAAAGKALEKKDLGMIAMTYGHIYVAKVS